MTPPRPNKPRDQPPGLGRRKDLRNAATQGAFILVAAVSVFGFVRAAKNDYSRSACTAACAMAPAYAGRNRTAPDFTLKDLAGNDVALSSFRGKTVILNFWASWCDPCREEMPSIAKLAMILRDRKDVVLVTVSVDEELTEISQTLDILFAADPETKEMVPRGEIPFAVLHDPEMLVTRDKYGTTMYPETWIIDREGYVRMRYDGAFDWSTAVALDAIDATSRGTGCLADFDKGRPIGPFAGLCETE